MNIFKDIIYTAMQGRNLSDNWGGGELFIYSCYAQRISIEIKSNSKEIRRAEHEYINKHPPQFLVCNQSLGMRKTMSVTHAGWIRQWN